MNNAPGSNEDGTPQGDSPTSGSEQSQPQVPTQSQSDNSASSSGEDNKAQAGSANQEGEGEKPVGQKGQERFAKLANENRQLSRRQQIEQRRDAILKGNYGQPSQAAPQVPAPNNSPQNPNPGLQPNLAASQAILARAEVQRMNDERELEKAAKKHPELDVDSDSYDSEFHDHVWDLKMAEGLSYSEAADKFKKIVSKYSQKAIERENIVNEEKSANSNQGGQRRTPVAETTQSSNLKAARERFNKTGSWEDLQKVRKLEYEAEN